MQTEADNLFNITIMENTDYDMSFLRAAEEEARRLGSTLRAVRTKREMPYTLSSGQIQGLREGVINTWREPYKRGMFLYAPNCLSSDDAVRSVWSEIVAKEGMEGVLGKKGYAKFCQAIFDNMTYDEKRIVARNAFYSMSREDMEKIFGSEVPTSLPLNKEQARVFIENDLAQRRIGQQYVAAHAATGEFRNPNIWVSIRAIISVALRKLGMKSAPSDSEIKAFLNIGYQKLKDDAAQQNAQHSHLSPQVNPEKGVKANTPETMSVLDKYRIVKAENGGKPLVFYNEKEYRIYGEAALYAAKECPNAGKLMQVRDKNGEAVPVYVFDNNGRSEVNTALSVTLDNGYLEYPHNHYISFTDKLEPYGSKDREEERGSSRIAASERTTMRSSSIHLKCRDGEYIASGEDAERLCAVLGIDPNNSSHQKAHGGAAATSVSIPADNFSDSMRILAMNGISVTVENSTSQQRSSEIEDTTFNKSQEREEGMEENQHVSRGR